MRNNPFFLFIPLIFAAGISCQNNQIITEFEIANPHDFSVVEAPVFFEHDGIPDLPEGRHLGLERRIGRIWTKTAVQPLSSGSEGTITGVFFLTELVARERAKYRLVSVLVKPDFSRRTQAFLKVQTGGRFQDGIYTGGTGFEKVTSVNVPDEQIQDSGWAYMEGPVWESDLVGYRFYLDTRNRVDIFGKSMPGLVLDTITTNYHLIHDWGTDVLKVGASLGLGSIAAYRDGQVQAINNYTGRYFEVVTNGPLQSVIRITYNGWQAFGRALDVISEIEIHAGNRYTEQRIRVTGDTSDMTFVTGIVKHPDAKPLVEGETSEAVYGWTRGIQSDQGHELLMNLVVPKVYRPEIIRTDPLSYLFAFRLDENSEARYRYASAWEFDHQPPDDFETFTLRMATLFTKPIQP